MTTQTGTPHLGSLTKTTFLKGIEQDNLHEEFEVAGLKYTMTFSAALVASNTIDGYVGGNAMPTVTYASSSDATMQAIATAIAAMDGVKTAVVTVVGGTQVGTDDRVIVVTPIDQTAGLGLTGFVVAAGGSQATVTVAAVNKRVYPGMPVELDATTGLLQPVTVATHDLTCIGIAVHHGGSGDLVTVALRGNAIIYVRSASAMGFVPVKFDSYDATNLYNKVEDGSVTVANQYGWTLDDAAGANETIRMVTKN